MKKSERFQDMDQVRTEKARLRAAREGYRHNLQEHWTVLGEKDFRRGLAGDVFDEMISNWRPVKAAMAFLDDKPQALANIAGSLLGAKKQTPWGRAITWGLTAATPYLTEKIGGNKSANTLLSELRISVDRIRNYMKQRRMAHSNGHHAPHDGVHDGLHG